MNTLSSYEKTMSKKLPIKLSFIFSVVHIVQFTPPTPLPSPPPQIQQRH